VKTQDSISDYILVLSKHQCLLLVSLVIINCKHYLSCENLKINFIFSTVCPFWSKNIPSCNLTACMPFCQFSFDVSSLHYVLGYQMLPLSFQSLIKFRNGGKWFQVFMYENVMFTFTYRHNLYVLTALTLSIFYCQAIIDNGSDTSYKLTRSSPLHINH
jgi:hypothetical protein